MAPLIERLRQRLARREAREPAAPAVPSQSTDDSLWPEKWRPAKCEPAPYNWRSIKRDWRP